MAIRGSCLCGGVRFEIDRAVGPVEFCHCTRCRKVSGSSAFCSRCGSPVPPVQPAGELFEIPAGTFDDDPGVRPDRHIFVELAPPWMEVGADLPAARARTLSPPDRSGFRPLFRVFSGRLGTVRSANRAPRFATLKMTSRREATSSGHTDSFSSSTSERRDRSRS